MQQNPFLSDLAFRIAQASDRAVSLNQLIERWLSVPAPLPPWFLWTFLSLVQHRRRHEFVADAVRAQLNGDLAVIANCGALGHPPGDQRGLLPGNVDWEFYFHGRGCCLTNRHTAESIDVDFFDDSADWLDPWFYRTYLESLRTPALWERRVLQLHPSIETVELAFRDLTGAGVLEKHSERQPVRIVGDYEPLLALLDQFEQVFEGEDGDRRIAAALGDWLWLSKLKGCESSQQIEQLADQMRRSRIVRLTEHFDSGQHRSMALRGLSEVQDPRLPEHLRRVLQESPSGLIVEALEIIEERSVAEWAEPILALSRRTDPNGDIPRPAIWLKCMELLFPMNSPSQELIRRLSKAGPGCCAEAAVLALEHAPGCALELFRQALRSRIPHSRIVASAVLTIIDQPWSRRELAKVLVESNEQDRTAECRAALMETHSADSHGLVRRWEERNPHEPEVGEWITMGELRLRGMSQRIQFEMEQWHDRVLPLRSVEPKEPRRWQWPWA